MPNGTLFRLRQAQGSGSVKINSSWSATTRTGVGTVHTFSQLGLRILDRDDVPPCDVLARARWPASSDPT